MAAPLTKNRLPEVVFLELGEPLTHALMPLMRFNRTKSTRALKRLLNPRNQLGVHFRDDEAGFGGRFCHVATAIDFT
jgi:hypothetical protein